jgi:hypothetical protein
MDLAAIIRVQTDISIEQQLEQIQELLLVTSMTDELIPEIASKAWNYLKTHKLWNPNTLALRLSRRSSTTILWTICLNETRC